MRDTEQLIAGLSTDLAPVPAHAVEKRVGLGLLIGSGLTLILVVTALGVRPDLYAAMRSFPFWMKGGYVIALAAVAIMAATRLMRPDAGATGGLWILSAPILIVGGMAFWDLANAPRARWPDLLLGQSWTVCSGRVLCLAVPIFIGLVWAGRRLAPTRLGAAGAAAGFAAGTLAATLYCLACTETSALFVLIWYSLGIFSATLLGALIGPRLMRW